MPVADLVAMLEIARQLRARERLENIHDSLAGSGWAKQKTVSRHLRQLEREATRGSVGPGSSGLGGTSMTMQDLAAAGVQFVRVPKDG